MLVRFPRGLDDDTAFINLISPRRTMDCILTNYSSIDFITTENSDVNSQYHVQFDGHASRGEVSMALGHSTCYCYQTRGERNFNLIYRVDFFFVRPLWLD